MKNTPYAISESSSLVAKLLERTEESKIAWAEGGTYGPDMETFETKLEGKLKVSISSDHSGITFTVLQENSTGRDRQMLSVSLEHDPSFGYDFPGESELHDSLIKLYELARRAALRVDENLAHARDYLERLAG
jgi:hypothetical protein